jgi:hypothetical protein
MDLKILLNRLAQPAQRAILSTGVTTLEGLSVMTEEEILDLHGIGKNAIKIIHNTLEEYGLSLRNESSSLDAAGGK